MNFLVDKEEIVNEWNFFTQRHSERNWRCS